MEDRKQSVIPTSGPLPVDAAAYAIGRNHKGMPPAKLGVPKGKKAQKKIRQKLQLGIQ